MKRHRRNQAAIAITFLTATAMPTSAQAPKSPAERMPYPNIVAGSSQVVIAEIISTTVVELRNDPNRPSPEPKSVEVHGRKQLIYPDTSSWDLSKLMDPPRLFALRGTLRVKAVCRGDVKEGSTVEVDLWYGIAPSFIQGAWKSYCDTALTDETHATLTLHLRPVDQSSVYDLVTKPWLVVPGTFDAQRGNMELRMRRFDALQEIETLVSKTEPLTDAELAKLRRLMFAEDPTLGAVNWTAGEQAAIERLFGEQAEGETSVAAYRTWWASEKNAYIDLPLRTIAGRDEN